MRLMVVIVEGDSSGVFSPQVLSVNSSQSGAPLHVLPAGHRRVVYTARRSGQPPGQVRAGVGVLAGGVLPQLLEDSQGGPAGLADPFDQPLEPDHAVGLL